MTPTAAILALALCTHPPLGLTVSAERFPLPDAASPARLESRPFERRVLLSVPASAAPGVARRLRGASRICPEVEVSGATVVLRCRTSRLRAGLTSTRAGVALDLHQLRIPSWRPEEEGPPLVPFDTAALGLGPCPGTSPELHGECELAAGHLDAARRLFLEAAAGGRAPLAELRLGDLALRDDDPDEARARWHQARAEAPWGRLAAARICELDAECLASDKLDAVYDAVAVALPLRADLVLRQARLLALAGRLVEAARLLAGETGPHGACAATAGWCRHVLLTALTQPPPEGSEALAIYLDLPERSEGPLALELVRAAATQAERAGAPVFAASLLAASSGRVPGVELSDHLRRVAELYLAGGDRARAEEILRFARTRLAAPDLARPPWAAIRRALHPTPAPAPAPIRAPAEDPDLQAARAALEASRLVVPARGARP